MVKVSVSMCVRRDPLYLEGSVQALADQTYDDWNLYCVVDREEDEEIVKEVTEKHGIARRTRVIYASEDDFIPTRHNRVIEASDAKYIAVNDTDDVSTPYRLKEQAKWLDREPINALSEYYRSAEIIDTDGNTIRSWKRPARPQNVKQSIFSKSPYIHSSLMHDASKQYRERIKWCSDWDLAFQYFHDEDLTLEVTGQNWVAYRQYDHRPGYTDSDTSHACCRSVRKFHEKEQKGEATYEDWTFPREEA